MPPTRSERSERARVAALTRSATESGSAISAPARERFLDRFTKPAPPGETEDQAAERIRQGRAALRLHMTRLSQKAAAARRAGTAAARLAGEVERDAAELLADEAV